jgi:hypothetical protein
MQLSSKLAKYFFSLMKNSVRDASGSIYSFTIQEFRVNFYTYFS